MDIGGHRLFVQFHHDLVASERANFFTAAYTRGRCDTDKTRLGQLSYMHGHRAVGNAQLLGKGIEVELVVVHDHFEYFYTHARAERIEHLFAVLQLPKV